MLKIFVGRVLNGFISLQEFSSLFSDPIMDFSRLFLTIDVIRNLIKSSIYIIFIIYTLRIFCVMNYEARRELLIRKCNTIW